MSVSKTVKKIGIRYRYEFKHKGKYIKSQYTYITKEAAREAETGHRNHLKGKTLGILVKVKLEEMHIQKMSKWHCSATKRYLNKLMDAYGDDMPVLELRHALVHKTVQLEALRLMDGGKTMHKANDMIRCLKTFFYWCERTQEVPILKNPLYKYPLFPVDMKKKYVPSEEEIKAVRSQLSVEQLYLFGFVYETACRVGEAIALDMVDVEKDKGTITLWTRKAKNRQRTPRVLPYPEIFNEFELPEEGSVFKRWNDWPHFIAEAIKDLALPCQTKAEKRKNSNGKKSKQQFIMKERWNWHNLRHRRTSLWGQEDMSMVEMMARLGHENMSTTMRYLRCLGFTTGAVSANLNVKEEVQNYDF